MMNRLHSWTALLVLIAPTIGFAQMRLPNPLLQPKIVKQVAKDGTDSDSLPPAPPGQQGSQNFLNSPPNMPYQVDKLDKEPFDSFAGIKNKLDGFYVSAIVGNQAILRRRPVLQQQAQHQGIPGQTYPGQVQQSGIKSGADTRQSSESIILRDGDAVNFVGDGVKLLPKIADGVVAVYYTDGVTKGRKSGGSNRVVFLGQVESADPVSTPAIVLEKPDPTYTALISVGTKQSRTQSTTSTSQSGTNYPPGGGNPVQPN